MKLKELRRNHNLTQQMIAEYLNCSTVNYSRYETGERQPSIEILGRLADFYHVSIDYLVGRDLYNSPTDTQAGFTQAAPNSDSPKSAQQSAGDTALGMDTQRTEESRGDKNRNLKTNKSRDLNLTLREAALIEAFRNADPRARNDSLNLLLIHDTRATKV